MRARFNVAIRTVAVDRSTGVASYGSGGGITWSSEPSAEWDEVLTKTAVLAPAPSDPLLLETMRADRAGRVAQLDRHLDRLAASADYLGYLHDDGRIRAVLREQVTTAGRVRLTLDRTGRVAVEVSALPAPTEGPVRLAVDTEPVDRHSPWLRHKTTHRAVYDSRRERWPDADDVVLVNAEGEITETTIASILVRIEGAWWTPPLDSGCLPGVGRGVLLDRGEVRERVLTVADLLGADDLAVVNALRGRRAARLAARTVRSSRAVPDDRRQ